MGLKKRQVVSASGKNSLFFAFAPRISHFFDPPVISDSGRPTLFFYHTHPKLPKGVRECAHKSGHLKHFFYLALHEDNSHRAIRRHAVDFAKGAYKKLLLLAGHPVYQALTWPTPVRGYGLYPNIAWVRPKNRPAHSRIKKIVFYQSGFFGQK